MLALLTTIGFGQASVRDSIDSQITEERKWNLPGDSRISLSHTSNSHWADEEQHSVFVHTDFSLEPEWQKNDWQFESKLDIALTYQKHGREPWRKPKDHLEFFGKLVYDIKPWFDVAVHADISTQLFQGYDYYGDWVHADYSSNFMSPAVVLYGLGADISDNPLDVRAVFSPLSRKITYVLDASLDETLFDLDSGKTSKSETGTFLMLGFEHEILKNTHIDLHGTLFMDYEKKGDIDYSFKSSLEFKPISFLSIAWDFRMVYDDEMQVQVYEDVNEDGNYDDFPSVKSVIQTSSQIKTGVRFNF